MSESAEKEMSQLGPPSSSSAEERDTQVAPDWIEVLERDLATARMFAESNKDDVDGPYWEQKVLAYEAAVRAMRADSRVPTGGEPEQENDHGAALTEGATACPLVPAAQLSHDAGKISVPCAGCATVDHCHTRGRCLVADSCPDMGSGPPVKRLRVFGPSNCPEDADCYIGDVDNLKASGVWETLERYLPEMTEGDELVFCVKAMTDAEVERLPDV